MTINIKKLRELAEDATPGPWNATGWQDESFDGNHIIENSEKKIVARTDASDLFENNAAFIAAFDPQTAIALLDEIDHKRAILEAQERRIGPKIGDDPVEVAKRWNGDSGQREPDFDMNPEDTASFLAGHIIKFSEQLAAMAAARDEARAEVDRLKAAFSDLADDICGLQPVGTPDDAIRAISQRDFKLRQELERFRPLVETAKGVAKHIQMPTNGDWACAECRPYSDMLHISPGWRCAQHAFLAALAALDPAPTTPAAPEESKP